MLNDRLKAMNTVAPALFASEAGVDDALQHSLRFIDAMLAAHQQARLAKTVGAEAIDEAGALVSTLLQARRHQVAVHVKLAELKDQIGLRAVAIGGGGEKPYDAVAAAPALQAA